MDPQYNESGCGPNDGLTSDGHGNAPDAEGQTSLGDRRCIDSQWMLLLPALLGVLGQLLRTGASRFLREMELFSGVWTLAPLSLRAWNV